MRMEKYLFLVHLIDIFQTFLYASNRHFQTFLYASNRHFSMCIQQALFRHFAMAIIQAFFHAYLIGIFFRHLRIGCASEAKPFILFIYDILNRTINNGPDRCNASKQQRYKRYRGCFIPLLSKPWLVWSKVRIT